MIITSIWSGQRGSNPRPSRWQRIRRSNHYEINNIIKDIKNNNFNDALEKTKLISENFPDKYTILKLFSSIYLNLKDYEKCDKILRKIIKL